MKIEKISDNQIRCTLNPSDLNSRHLSIKELAYGGAKARELFHEMLQIAHEQVGFVTQDMPLMIEAIPLSGDGIMLIVTKIDDPDELDTRFSRFAPSMERSQSDVSDQDHEFTGSANEFLESLKHMIEDTLHDPELESTINDAVAHLNPDPPGGELSEHKEEVPTAATPPSNSKAAANPSGDKNPPVPTDMTSIYIFRSLEDLLQAAEILHHVYQGENTLYKSPADHRYYLVLHKSSHTPEVFNKVCNIMTEYGERRKGYVGTEAYYAEHMDILIARNALQVLAGE